MFRGVRTRKKHDDLPIATHLASEPDGSGRAVKMDAPIVRAWKHSSRYTKGSYYWFFSSALVIWLGWRHIRYNHASIWLNCHSTSCTLSITPPGRKKTLTMDIPRNQLVRSEPVKVTPENVIVEINPRIEPIERDPTGKKKKKKVYDSRRPDENGNYDSYTVVFREAFDIVEYTSEEDEKKSDVTRQKTSEEEKQKEGADSDAEKSILKPLEEFASVNERGEYILLMRKFNLGQSKRRVRSMTTKITSYIHNRRHKMTVKENRSVTWQGILAMVCGLFSLLMSVLVGQFWETSEGKNPYIGGPGARRQRPTREGTTLKTAVGSRERQYVQKRHY